MKKTNHPSFILTEAKEDFDNAYKEQLNTNVNGKINIITNTAENQLSRLAWETINEITGRKNTLMGNIKAHSQEVCLNKGKDHFHKLLEQPPLMKEQEINQVSQEKHQSSLETS